MSPTRGAGTFHLVPFATAAVVGVVGWLGQPGVARHLAASAADARQLYLRDCAVCHGPDAESDAGDSVDAAETAPRSVATRHASRT
jgi:mono/diheme cytochrome c family protein